jgi:hypothetical protein
MEDDNTDLQQLLGQLEQIEPDNIPEEMISTQQNAAVETEINAEVKAEIATPASAILVPAKEEFEAPRPININKYLDRLDGVTDEVLNACRSDRQEAQEVIHLLRGQINDAIINNKQPSRMWVDGLVKAVEVKSLVNMTAVKIIEANAKILAATKAGSTNVQVNNNNVTVAGTDKDLEKILDEPLTSDDEY